MSQPSIDVKQRLKFVDSAKGISIFLVVLLHTMDEKLALNAQLVFLRMPLFFFVAGLFAIGILNASLRGVIREKVGQLMWIYVVWSILFFFSTTVVKQLFGPEASGFDLYPLYSIPWNPMVTMWFVYALAICFVLVRVTTSIPRHLLIVAALALYCWSVAVEEWAHPEFLHKVARLVPVFMIGVLYSKQIINAAQKYAAFAPLLIAVAAGLSYFIFTKDLSAVGPITFAASAVSIAAVLTACALWSGTAPMQFAAWLGEKSVYIYVMHWTVSAYTKAAADIFQVRDLWFADCAIVASALLIPATLGAFFIDRFCPILIKAPWLRKKSAGHKMGQEARA